MVLNKLENHTSEGQGKKKKRKERKSEEEENTYMLENLSIMLVSVTLKTTALRLIMLEKQQYARLALSVFNALFHPRRHEYNI